MNLIKLIVVGFIIYITAYFAFRIDNVVGVAVLLIGAASFMG